MTYPDDEELDKARIVSVEWLIQRDRAHRREAADHAAPDERVSSPGPIHVGEWSHCMGISEGGASTTDPRFGPEELAQLREFVQCLAPSTAQNLQLVFRAHTEFATLVKQHQFLQLLSQTVVVEAPAIVDAALRTLLEAVTFARPREDASSYANWLVRLAFDEVLRRFDARALNELLTRLGRGGKVTVLEHALAGVLPSVALELAPPVDAPFWLSRRELHQRIHALMLSPVARECVELWMHRLLGADAGTGHVPATTLVALLEHNLARPERAGHIDRALCLAFESTLPLLRLARLRMVLANREELSALKLAELADPDLTILGVDHPWDVPRQDRPVQSNAYLGKLVPARVLAEMKTQQNQLLDPAASAARAEVRNKILSDYVSDRIERRCVEHSTLSEVFRRLADPLSLAFRNAMLQKTFDVRVLPGRFFDAEARMHATATPAEHGAYYFPPGHVRDRGLVLVRVPESTLAHPNNARRDYFEVLCALIHEYQHVLEIEPGQRRTQLVHLQQEMSAHYTEALWRARHGETHPYREYVLNSSLGPAMRFHDLFERMYRSWWARETCEDGSC